MAERERALGALLDDAMRALADDPDVAGLLLDGVLSQIVAHWYARRRLMEPGAPDRLADLARCDAPFAWRLRLALRAPDPAARLEHACHLLRALDERDPADARHANDANDANDVNNEVIARAAG
jgi:hypothetical protein